MVVDGFSNLNEADDYVAEEDLTSPTKPTTMTARAAPRRPTKKLEELKNQALRTLRPHRDLFEKVHKVYDKGGLRHAGYSEGATCAVGRADDHPLHGQDHREAVRHGSRPGG